MCVVVSHFHWRQKQTGDPSFFLLLSDNRCLILLPPSPSLWIHLSLPGCLDRFFICPGWARKGYCDSRRKLMQKHCPSSCDFCYGKTAESGSSLGEAKWKVVSRLRWTGCLWSNRSQQVQPHGAVMDGFKDVMWGETVLYSRKTVASPGRLSRMSQWTDSTAAWLPEPLWVCCEMRRCRGLLLHNRKRFL